MTTTSKYVAGWNMPGYMPDMDPAEFETADEALEFIHASIEEGIEQEELDMPIEDISQLKADANGEFGATIGKYHYWISYQQS